MPWFFLNTSGISLGGFTCLSAPLSLGSVSYVHTASCVYLYHNTYLRTLIVCFLLCLALIHHTFPEGWDCVLTMNSSLWAVPGTWQLLINICWVNGETLQLVLASVFLGNLVRICVWLYSLSTWDCGQAHRELHFLFVCISFVIMNKNTAYSTAITPMLHYKPEITVC